MKSCQERSIKLLKIVMASPFMVPAKRGLYNRVMFPGSGFCPGALCKAAGVRAQSSEPIDVRGRDATQTPQWSAAIQRTLTPITIILI